jgi:diacylglycerol kinase family enzyme
VNPFAGKLSERSRDEVVDVLSRRFDLDVHTTSGRGSAIPMAAKLVSEGARLVIAFGGDGHVNEVANGLAGTEAELGIIPGGTMNVFARSLGLPTDAAKAAELLETLGTKVVHLGKMNDRYFTFSAGCGFDAEAARIVEDHLNNKRRFGEVYFYWSAFRVLAGSYRLRRPALTLSGPFGEVSVSMAIACNTGPYAYLLNRPVRITPEVHLEKGLDVFALKSMRIEALPFYAFRAIVNGDLSRTRDSFYANDLETFSLTGPEPFARHVDGEPIEPADRVEFSLARDVLKVRA